MSCYLHSYLQMLLRLPRWVKIFLGYIIIPAYYTHFYFYNSALVGHSDESFVMKSGPFHHIFELFSSSELIPRLGRSAGFWGPAQCLHCSAFVWVSISANLSATHTLYLVGPCLIRHKFINKSVKQCVSWILYLFSNAFLRYVTALAVIKASNSSSHTIENVSSGISSIFLRVILDFDSSRFLLNEPS